MQSLGEILNKGAAPRRARFVQRDVADAAVLHEEALHILTADVEHEADIGAELLRRAQMGKGLDLAAVRVERRLDDRLAVARRHCARNMRTLGHNGVKLAQGADDRLERRAVIAAVGRVEELLVAADRDELRRRRACIDADADRAAVVRKLRAFYLVAVMSRLERGVVCRIAEQREVRCPRLGCRRLLRTRNTLLHLPHINRPGII